MKYVKENYYIEGGYVRLEVKEGLKGRSKAGAKTGLSRGDKALEERLSSDFKMRVEVGF